MATMGTESSTPPTLVTKREPVGPAANKSQGTSIGEQAFKDALTMIGIASALLLVLVWSLRGHII